MLACIFTAKEESPDSLMTSQCSHDLAHAFISGFTSPFLRPTGLGVVEQQCQITFYPPTHEVSSHVLYVLHSSRIRMSFLLYSWKKILVPLQNPGDLFLWESLFNIPLKATSVLCFVKYTTTTFHQV